MPVNEKRGEANWEASEGFLIKKRHGERHSMMPSVTGIGGTTLCRDSAGLRLSAERSVKNLPLDDITELSN